MALMGLFANIRSFKNHTTFFFPQNNGILGGKELFFWLLKTCLNHCCQAGDTRKGTESSSGSLCFPRLAEAKQLPASPPGSGSHRNSRRSQAALTYPSLAGKIAAIHVKQKPFIL